MLITAGPVRDGYVQITGDGSSTYFYDGQGEMTSGIVSANASSPLTEISCAANSVTGCAPGPHYYSVMNPLIPISLGTNINLAATGFVNDWVGPLDGQSGGELDTTFQFRFFEADGVTPVAVSDVPEPATWGLIAFIGGAVLVVKRGALRALPEGEGK